MFSPMYYLRRLFGMGLIAAATLHPQAAGASSIHQVTTTQELQSIISASTYVVVKFYAPWCGPCKQIAPIIDQFARDFPQVTFVQVQADQAKTVARDYQVRSLPTLLFFKDGVLIKTHIGAGSKEALKNILKNTLGI